MYCLFSSHIHLSTVVERQFISSLLLCLFSLCLSKHSISLYFSAAQSLIFRLLLGGKEMNRGRENWSPSVTTGVVGVLKAAGFQEIRLTFRLGMCVYPIICYLDGSACSAFKMRPSATTEQIRLYHTGRWGHNAETDGKIDAEKRDMSVKHMIMGIHAYT